MAAQTEARLIEAVEILAEASYHHSSVTEVGLLCIGQDLRRLADAGERIASALETLANRDVTTIDATGKP